MAEGAAAAAVDAFLDSTFDGMWAQLHVGAPGAAGTSNVASNTTRKQATFSASSGGAKTTSADLDWLSVPTAEDYTHVSFWSASTAGTFKGSGTITANAVAVGDDFTIAAGDVDITMPVAS